MQYAQLCGSQLFASFSPFYHYAEVHIQSSNGSGTWKIRKMALRQVLNNMDFLHFLPNVWYFWWFLKVEHVRCKDLFNLPKNPFLHGISKTQVSGTRSVTNTKAHKMRTLSPRRLWSHIGLFVRIYRYSLSPSLSGCPHPKKNKRYLVCPLTHWVYLGQKISYFITVPLNSVRKVFWYGLILLWW